MTKKLKQLETLARKWREYSYLLNGWHPMEYKDKEGLKVGCYFAPDANFTSVEIGGISIFFMCPIEFDASTYCGTEFNELTYYRIENIEDIIRNYSEWLEKKIEEYGKYKYALKIEEARKKLGQLQIIITETKEEK